ncbi:hypothetical protein [Vagococcus fluvialis]|nr:hypothetical protein [Vagococcus fluvialis]MDT2747991.1 hypothetical protein [Vagococcus fluvialis]RCX15255.1 hypothetical protein DFR54_102316 [Vagococcus fluvialis]
MTLSTQVTFGKNKTVITSDSLETVLTLSNIKTIPSKLNEDSTYLLYEDKTPIFIGSKKELTTFEKKGNFLVEIQTKQDIEPIYLNRMLKTEALEQGLSLTGEVDFSVPANITSTFKELLSYMLLILEKMGYPLQAVEKKKSKLTKARHKWTKEVSEKEFFIDTRSSKATVMWIKRNQMLIKKGATMMKEAPLNKDGSVGFSAKMGDKIRSENLDKFKNFVTTEDIILKSVNEVGLFLYFAGTNSWLEMIDKDGKTLNELTVVE